MCSAWRSVPSCGRSAANSCPARRARARRAERAVSAVCPSGRPGRRRAARAGYRGRCGHVRSFQLPHIPIERLDWIALAGIVTATAVCLRRSQRALPPADALWPRPVGHRHGTLGPATHAADVLLVGGRRVGRLRPGRRRLPDSSPSACAEPRAERDEYRLVLQLSKRWSSPWPARWPYGSRSISASTAAAMKASAGVSPAGWLPCRDYFSCLLAAIVMAGVAQRGRWRARWQYGDADDGRPRC